MRGALHASLLLAAALALAACSGGSGGDSGGPSPAPTIDESWASICAQPLGPGSEAPNAERFRSADEGLAEMEQLLEQGDLQGAGVVFFWQVHDLTHDIDGPLRSADPPLARELCAVIGQMETEFAADGPAESMKLLTRRTRELMRGASELLGYSE